MGLLSNDAPSKGTPECAGANGQCEMTSEVQDQEMSDEEKAMYMGITPPQGISKTHHRKAQTLAQVKDLISDMEDLEIPAIDIDEMVRSKYPEFASQLLKRS